MDGIRSHPPIPDEKHGPLSTELLLYLAADDPTRSDQEPSNSIRQQYKGSQARNRDWTRARLI